MTRDGIASGSRRPPRLAWLALLCGVATSCSGAGAEQWDPAVVRAVARQADAELDGERLVVLHTIGGADGAELPWAARQALATAGIEVVDTTVLREPGVALLVFQQSRLMAGDWQVTTRLVRAGAPPVGDAKPSRRWLVRCPDQQCTAQPMADESVSYAPPAAHGKHS
jgi:hypothetical protein